MRSSFPKFILIGLIIFTSSRVGATGVSGVDLAKMLTKQNKLGRPNKNIQLGEPRAEPDSDNCRLAIEALDRVIPKIKLRLVGRQEQTKVIAQASAAFWRLDVITDLQRFFHQWNLSANVGVNAQLDTTKYFLKLRELLHRQSTTPPSWHFHNQQLASAFVRMQSEEGQRDFRIRMDEYWNQFNPGEWGDGVKERVKALGISERGLSQERREALQRFFQKHIDPILLIFNYIRPNWESQLKPREWIELLNAFHISEEEWSRLAVHQDPTLKEYFDPKKEPGYWRDSTNIKYFPLDPIYGNFARYLIEKIGGDPNTVVFQPVPGDENQRVIALPRIQIWLKFDDRGEVTRVNLSTYSDDEILNMLPRIRNRTEPKRDFVASSFRSPVSGKPRTPNEEDHQQVQPIDLSGWSLPITIESDVKAMNETYPGNEDFLSEDLPLVLREYPLLQSESEWSRFQKDIVLILKAKLGRRFASEQTLSLLENWKFRDLPASASEAQVELKPAVTQKIEQPKVALQHVEDPAGHWSVEFNEKLRAPLKALLDQDLHRAEYVLYDRYGEKFRQVRSAIRFLKYFNLEDYKRELRSFIDWVTYRGNFIADFAKRFPGYAQGTEKLDYDEQFSMWRAYSDWANQEHRFSPHSERARLIPDSSIIGRGKYKRINEMHPEAASYPEIVKMLEESFGLKFDIEILPQVLREMSSLPFGMTQAESTGPYYISQQMAPRASDSERGIMKAAAEKFTTLKVGVTDETKPGEPTDDSKILMELARASRDTKELRVFPTLDANFFLPLLILGREGATRDWGPQFKVKFSVLKLQSVEGRIVPLVRVQMLSPYKAEFYVIHPYWIPKPGHLKVNLGAEEPKSSSDKSLLGLPTKDSVQQSLRF